VGVVTEDITANFKMAMRRMTSPVCLITTRAGQQSFGMAATAVQSISVDPPSLLVCINKLASLSRPLSERGRFAVNVLHTSHVDLVSIFSGKVENKDRFGYGVWSELEDMPVLEDAQAVMICDRTATFSVGSHDIVVGEVRTVRVSAEIAPLLYEDGKLARSLLLDFADGHAKTSPLKSAT
jgi:flavin reductase